MGATTSGGNGLGPLNTTSFLFDDNDDKHSSLNGFDLKSPLARTFAQLEGDDFPTLTSNGGQVNLMSLVIGSSTDSTQLSANLAAIDLAKDDAWAVGSRFRPAHQSMPHTDSSMYRPVLSNLASPPAERPAEIARRKSQRHSMGVTFEENTNFETTPATLSVSRPTSLQTSYSTNDVPTVKTSLALETMMSPPKTQAEQQLHNHNVNMGRIPANAINNRQSREVAGVYGTPKPDDKNMGTNGSNLQASATPFGPNFTSPPDYSMMNITSPTSGYASPPIYAHSMQSYSLNQMAPAGAANGFPAQNQSGYAINNGYAGYSKDNARANNRRNHQDEARFNNVPLESYHGNLYELCKDQHGCRYLQRKLEDGNAEHIQSIFIETCPHIIELMTDPFGNYLCQKLFEHCNDEQRTALINAAAPALTIIALNQHGTRALQKMIEFVHTPEQVETIIRSLSERVVELVQDLNGNHVVQKCLTRLGAERCQFIYDAVGGYCVIVGTHRHGCCVLQRCIDHAQGFQRAQLIGAITRAAFELVQDPFGNYVVQYILDLDEPSFTTPLCQAFAGKVVSLSKQKFSSNVIEKCLRTADMGSKCAMVDEMLAGNELEKMLRDSFANYVVQTAMEHVDPQTKLRIVDAVRPILPAIKQTPHGRRIASKIMGGSDGPGRVSGTSSGQMTPNENFAPAFSSTGRAGGRRQVQIVGGGFNGPRYNGGYGSGDVGNGNGNFGNTFQAMQGQGPDFGEAPINMYNPQGFQANPSAGYGGFQNGQLGGNYI